MGTTASIMEDGTMYHHIIALHLDEDSKSKADLSGNEGLAFLIYTPSRPSCQPPKIRIYELTVIVSYTKIFFVT